VPGSHRRHRVQESIALLGLQVVATAVHIVPRLVYSQRTNRITTRIVAQLAELGPLWVVMFGVTALMLSAALWWRHGQATAHILCGAVWVFYDANLWIGALADTPRGTVFFPITVAIIVAWHLIVATSYNDDADYPPAR
jgi:hypothetical protein